MSNASRLAIKIGMLELKNPIIAAAAEHMIDESGVCAAIAAGAGAVVVKSTNESEVAKDQLQRAEYIALDPSWNAVPWNKHTAENVTLATRSGLSPLQFSEWLNSIVALDCIARKHETLLIPSLVLSHLDASLSMAKEIEQAGLRVLELNIGTPYGSLATERAVATELDPKRVSEIVHATCSTVSIPVWIKITGQSERVPELAEAAFAAGAQSVVMAGRLLGLIPDLETMEPLLGTSLGIGGFWNLPLTCQWLALTRQRLGAEKPLIGLNGVRNGRDAARMILAGATGVGMASAVMLRGPQVLTGAIEQLNEYLISKNMTAQSLIGLAADRRRAFSDMELRTDHWRSFVGS
ncbi:beta/alpha barrel domain-containing protein [Acidocella aminolytica]|uniref:dihydrouracil dehydrogenase (NAD(+)) n=1 Tax=Acidocella aminolytica 101 = DSM 11237 TaxID=1120923 RepID=A0A0D6PIR0_9PROT|nr:tRNA-dihydrouridine synthase [Acidocella aminolytica]GAN81567.1 dihydroorotate oxidase [Acidocella aminolytica 101 = DSM 11237]GBQ36020.1 dihydroorotate dehydrogenase [Acidocella aminolytica 101 = DSM 11237]SHF47865.1 dihydroorotate dehydrogenase (NAD+) catalytic subunit [Acidocella aminolytica 101 = DSM 11237]